MLGMQRILALGFAMGLVFAAPAFDLRANDSIAIILNATVFREQVESAVQPQHFLAVALALFLLAVLVSGIDVLWEATKSATPLLLSVAISARLMPLIANSF